MPSQASLLRAFLADLVAFQTDTGNANETDRLFKYVQDQLPKHLHTEEFTSEGFKTLILATHSTKHPKLTLGVHVDVVPGAPEQYHLTRQDDKLIGRGVFDMKFALACYILLVQELQDELADYDFALALNSDEEAGGEHGAAEMLKRGFQTEAYFVPDGSNHWNLEAHTKGAWIGRVIAKGIPAHGSQPWLADNPIFKLMNAITAMQKLSGTKIDSTTVSITRLKAGKALSRIPETAEATFDVRYFEPEDFQAVHQAVEKIAAAHDCRIETIVDAKSSKTDPANPYVKQYTDIVAQITGKQPNLVTSFGANDGRFFTAKGIPTITLRPEGGGSHGDHEWISQSGLEDYYKVLKQYVTQVAILN